MVTAARTAPPIDRNLSVAANDRHVRVALEMERRLLELDGVNECLAV